MTTSSSMVDYYEARAPHFEAVYDRPERQADLLVLRHWLAREAQGLTLLEVACGSGYWTRVAASTAKAILAIDCNPSPLALASSKTWGRTSPSRARMPSRCQLWRRNSMVA